MPCSCRAHLIVNDAADPAPGLLAALKIRPQAHDKTHETHRSSCGSLVVPAILILCLALQVVLAVHALHRHRRDGWLLLILMLPGVGALLVPAADRMEYDPSPGRRSGTTGGRPTPGRGPGARAARPSRGPGSFRQPAQSPGTGACLPQARPLRRSRLAVREAGCRRVSRRPADPPGTGPITVRFAAIQGGEALPGPAHRRESELPLRDRTPALRAQPGSSGGSAGRPARVRGADLLLSGTGSALPQGPAADQPGAPR